VLFDKPQELSNLIWLGLTSIGLKIERLWYVRVNKDVMTAAHSIQSEPKALDKVYHITELNIFHRSPC